MTIIREERIGNQRLILGDCMALSMQEALHLLKELAEEIRV